MPLLGLIGWLLLFFSALLLLGCGLSFTLWLFLLLAFRLLLLFCSSSRGILDNLRVPVHVKPVRTVGPEQKLLEMSLEFSLSDGRQECDLMVLSVELVAVRAEFTVPCPVEVHLHILISF